MANEKPLSSKHAPSQINLRLEAIQMVVDPEQREANAEHILDSIASSTAEIVVFPESASAGFPYRELESLSEWNRQLLDRVCNAARQSGRGVILPLLLRSGNYYFNRQSCIDSSGSLIGHYDKLHLIGLLEEDRYLTAGNRLLRLPWPCSAGGSVEIGFATCYDLRFPELFRAMVGVDLFVVVAMWPIERREHLLVLSQARAIENQTPLLLVNAVGSCGNLELCGGSTIYSARGEITARAALLESIDPVATLGPEEFAKSYEGRLVLDLNTEKSASWRRRFPVLKDRRSDLLRELSVDP